MNKGQNAFINMCAGVRATCEAHASEWSGFVPFATAYAEFLTLYHSLPSLVGGQSNTTTGKTYAKGQARDALTERLLQLSQGLALHHTLQNAPLKKAEAHVSRRTLNAGSGLALVGWWHLLQGLAAGEAPAHLAQLGITADFLQNLKAEGEAFVKQLDAPRAARSERKGATASLADTIAALRTLLRDRMDLAVQVLGVTKPDFAGVYKNSRMIKDISVRRNKGGGEHAEQGPDEAPAG